jgi:hypothetical protein
MSAPAAVEPTYVDVRQLPPKAVRALLFRAGQLSWLLEPHQLEVYEKYRHWEQHGIGKIFVLDCARRYGKTTLVAAIKCEDCLQQPGTTHTFAHAFFDDISEVIVPVIDWLFDGAPEDVKPVYFASKKGFRKGYYFPNGSKLLLIGLDVKPKGRRGRASDGYAVTEAGHVRRLKRTVGGVIMPMLMRRPRARLILESSAPEDLDHDFESFCEKAKIRDAYVFKTLWDNTALSQEEKEAFYKESADIEIELAQREYDGKRIRPASKRVVPNYDPGKHMYPIERPKYALAMASIDPGFKDLFAILWAYWHPTLQKLVVEHEYAQRNQTTHDIAIEIRKAELELYGNASVLARGGQKLFGHERLNGLSFWKLDRGAFHGNPALRVSDTSAQLIGDLVVSHGIDVGATRKDDKEAALYALRDAFARDKIVVQPSCPRLSAHLQVAVWNDKRTDYERTENYGHYDLVDALVYMWRMVDGIRAEDPEPPRLFDGNRTEVHFSPVPQRSPLHEGLAAAFAPSTW